MSDRFAPRLGPAHRSGAVAASGVRSLLAILALVTTSSAAAAAMRQARQAPATAAVPADTGRIGRAGLRVGTLDRTFLYYSPPALRPGAPAVLVFHGAGGAGARIRGFIGRELERLADAQGFVVVYPDGHGTHWNDCRAGAPYPAKRDGIDDIAFVRALIRWLEERHAVDAARVRAIGFSNGGHFALRLALEMPAQIEAAVAIGAALPVAQELDCRPGRRAAPVLLINGTADPVNPFDDGVAVGGDGARLGAVRSTPRTGADLARLVGSRGPLRRDTLLARADGTGVERLRWGAGRRGVELLVVHGGGHTIPGSPAAFPSVLGRVEPALDAAAEAVRFFGGLPRRARADRGRPVRQVSETLLKSP